MKKTIKTITKDILKGMLIAFVMGVVLLSPVTLSTETKAETNDVINSKSNSKIITQPEIKQTEIYERAYKYAVRKDMSAPKTYNITDTYTLVDITYDENGKVATKDYTYLLYIRDTDNENNTKIISLEENAFNLYSRQFYIDPECATINIVQNKENGAYYVSYRTLFVRVLEEQI